MLLLAAAVFPSLRHVVLGLRFHDDNLKLLARYARDLPSAPTAFAFEPAWTLAMNRLPHLAAGSPPVVDTYAAMLLAVHGSGRRYPSAEAAFADPAAARAVEDKLARCDLVLFGLRGATQLGPEGLARALSSRRQVESEQVTGLALWSR